MDVCSIFLDFGPVEILLIVFSCFSRDENLHSYRVERIC